MDSLDRGTWSRDKDRAEQKEEEREREKERDGFSSGSSSRCADVIIFTFAADQLEQQQLI